MVKIKILSLSGLSLGSLVTVSADSFDNMVSELKKEGFDVSVKERKIVAKTHDEFLEKKRESEVNGNEEIDRMKNFLNNYKQGNNIIEETKKQNTYDNARIKDRNEAVKSENERRFREWASDVERINKENAKIEAKYLEEKEYADNLREEIKKEAEKYKKGTVADSDLNKSDYDKQVADIMKKNAEIEKENKQRRADVERENASRKQHNDNNKVIMEKFTREVEAYNKEKANVEAENARIKADNERLKKEYEEEYTRVNTEIIRREAEYKKLKEQYDLDKAEFDKALSIFNNNKASFEKEFVKYTNDKKAYDEALAKYNIEKDKYDRARDKYERDKGIYDAGKVEYDKAKAKYEIDKKEYDRLIDEFNAKQRTYESDLAKYEQDYANWLEESRKPKRKVIVSSNESEVKEAIANSNGQDIDYELRSYQWNNRRPVTIDGDIHVAGVGNISSGNDLLNGRYTINAYSDSDKLSDDNVITSVSWQGQAARPYNGSTVVDGDMVNGDYQNKVGTSRTLYDMYSGGTTRIQSVRSGEWFMIPKAVTLKNGDKRDLYVKLTKGGDSVYYGRDWFTIWNAGGAINYYNGANKTPLGDNVSVAYSLGDGKKYFWAAAMIDLDLGQYVNLSDNAKILGNGGGVAAREHFAESNENLGTAFGKNSYPSKQALDGVNSAPDGVFTYAAYGEIFGYRISNTRGGNSIGIANGDFGTSVNVNIVTRTVKVTEERRDIEEPRKPTPPERPVAPIPPDELNEPGAPVKPEAPKPVVEPKPPISPKAPFEPKPPVKLSIPKKVEEQPLKPLPKEPEKPKVEDKPILKTPEDRPLLDPPTIYPKTPEFPDPGEVKDPVKGRLKTPPVKPVDEGEKPPVSVITPDPRPRKKVEVVKLIVEYLNTSSGVGGNVRKFGKATFGNSSQIRKLAGDRLSYGNSNKIRTLNGNKLSYGNSFKLGDVKK